MSWDDLRQREVSGKLGGMHILTGEARKDHLRSRWLLRQRLFFLKVEGLLDVNHTITPFGHGCSLGRHLMGFVSLSLESYSYM